MKLVVNAWLIAMMQGIAESTQLASGLGFSLDDLWNVLERGPWQRLMPRASWRLLNKITMI